MDPGARPLAGRGAEPRSFFNQRALNFGFRFSL